MVLRQIPLLSGDSGMGSLCSSATEYEPTAHKSSCKFTSEQGRTPLLMWSSKTCSSLQVKHQVLTISAGRRDMLSPKSPGSLLSWKRWEENQAGNGRCQRSARLWDLAKGLVRVGGCSRFFCEWKEVCRRRWKMAGACQSTVSTTETYWVTTFRRLWDGNDGEDGKAHAQDLHFCEGTVITGCNCPTHILSGMMVGSKVRKQLTTCNLFS